MPCDHPLTKCANCGKYVTEREWAANGAHAKPIDSGTDGGLLSKLASVALLGERKQFCSAACKRADDEESR